VGALDFEADSGLGQDLSYRDREWHLALVKREVVGSCLQDEAMTRLAGEPVVDVFGQRLGALEGEDAIPHRCEIRYTPR
jgi:hypothetical protein